MYPFDEEEDEKAKKDLLEQYLTEKLGQKAPEAQPLAESFAPVQEEIDAAKSNERDIDNAYLQSGLLEAGNQIGSAFARQDYKPGMGKSLIEKAKELANSKEKSAKLATAKQKSDRDNQIFSAKQKREADEMDPNSEQSKRQSALINAFAQKQGIDVDTTGLSAKEMKEYLPKLMDMTMKKEQIISSRENAQANRDMAQAYRQSSLDIQKQNLGMAKDREADRKVEAEHKKQDLGATQAKQLGNYKLGELAEKQYNEAVKKAKTTGKWDPTAYSDALDNSQMTPNFAKDDNAIAASSAQEAWVEVFLRDASGAAIPKDERLNYATPFFPRPGDTPKVVANKAALRKQKMENALIGAGSRGSEKIAKDKTDASKMGAGNGPVTYDDTQEKGITRVMEKNGISREEAIEALREAGKL